MMIVASIGHAQTYDLVGSKKANSTTLLFVHGGAWISGDSKQYSSMANKLSQSGFCVATLNYSLAPQSKHPKPVQDLNAAIENLITKKSKFCNFKKLFLLGHSAGAHMIAYWATQNSVPEVKGFIGLEGIYDIPNLAKTWPSYENWFLKSEFGIKSDWEMASPARRPLKSKSPWLLVHSEKDELVDTRQTLDFEAHLKEENIKVDFLKLLDLGHFAVVDSLSDTNSVLTTQTLKFIHLNE